MVPIESILAGYRGKRVAVVGIGVSNTPLIKMLLRAGLSVTACDRAARAALGGITEELESLGAQLRLGEDYLDRLDHDVIFRTPGMRPDVPALAAAREKGSVITSEMELFFMACPCPIIGVTGSDGKTTTTTIIARLLQAAGRKTYLGGNIGRPLLPDVAGMLPEDMAVVELSSFQLMTMTQSPQIAVVTNLAPNHLDVHTSMSEYIAAKENIFSHQSAQDRAVFNLDNEITRAFAARAPGRVSGFSRRTEPEAGVFLRGGAIWARSEGHGRPEERERNVLPLRDILLPGAHNVENYMAAIAAVDGLVPDQIIRAFAADFGGVEHRIELVRELDGVRYYNDSIASSPSRTIAGLRAFSQKVILIAGGYDKHIPFDALGAEIVERVDTLILTGDTAPQIRAAVEGAPGYAPGRPGLIACDDFDAAVRTAARIAARGDVVLLSPACASFDRFANFARRGEAFKKIIYEL